MPATKVLIIGELPLVRVGLAAILNRRGCRVIAHCSLAQSLRARMPRGADVVLLDVDCSLPLPVAEAVVAVRKWAVGAALLVVSATTCVESLRSYFCAGADGYLSLKSGPDDLRAALQAMAERRRFVDPHLSAEFFSRDLDDPPSFRRARAARARLSRREREVLRMVAEGHSGSHIAGVLGLSRKTVQTYRARAQQKLGLRGRVDIVSYALAAGLLAQPRSGAA